MSALLSDNSATATHPAAEERGVREKRASEEGRREESQDLPKNIDGIDGGGEERLSCTGGRLMPRDPSAVEENITLI